MDCIYQAYIVLLGGFVKDFNTFLIPEKMWN